MPTYIVKIPHDGKDYYMEWSTIVDAPATFGMELEEFNQFMTEEYGRKYMEDVHPERMKRVEEKGTSSKIHDSFDELLIVNRAGDNENKLSLNEIIDKYMICRGK